MKKTTATLLLASTVLLATDTEEKNIDISPIFGLTTHVEKQAYDNGSSDNVDAFYGRAVFGIDVNSEKFEGKIAIKAYPEGFGYELLRGVQFPQDSLEGSVLLSQIAKFQVDDAYACFKREYATITIGRTTLFNSNAAFFGNYIDEGPGGYFTGKGVSGNFVQAHSDYAIGTSALTIGTQDPKINNGYIRFFQDFNFLDNGHVGFGVRSDVLNRVNDPSADTYTNVSFVLDYSVNGTVKLFFETGITSATEDDSGENPFLWGVQFPAGKVFDLVAIEAEYLVEDDRPIIDDKQQSPILLGLYADHQFNDHLVFQAGVFTEREISEVGLGLHVNIML